MVVNARALTPTAKEFLNSCQDGTNPICLGITSKSNSAGHYRSYF
jgi:hypothetical protein